MTETMGGISNTSNVSYYMVPVAGSGILSSVACKANQQKTAYQCVAKTCYRQARNNPDM